MVIAKILFRLVRSNGQKGALRLSVITVPFIHIFESIYFYGMETYVV